jgi:hypothetical protein
MRCGGVFKFQLNTLRGCESYDSWRRSFIGATPDSLATRRDLTAEWLVIYKRKDIARRNI